MASSWKVAGWVTRRFMRFARVESFPDCRQGHTHFSRFWISISNKVTSQSLFSISARRLNRIISSSEKRQSINGIIIDMEPIGPWHADIVQIFAHMFELQAHEQFSVRVQSPIDLGPESQP
jgi:hypothetical protein